MPDDLSRVAGLFGGNAFSPAGARVPVPGRPKEGPSPPSEPRRKPKGVVPSIAEAVDPHVVEPVQTSVGRRGQVRKPAVVDDVRKTQQALVRAGFLEPTQVRSRDGRQVSSVDGVWGKDTERAWRLYQKARKSEDADVRAQAKEARLEPPPPPPGMVKVPDTGSFWSLLKEGPSLPPRSPAQPVYAQVPGSGQGEDLTPRSALEGMTYGDGLTVAQQLAAAAPDPAQSRKQALETAIGNLVRGTGAPLALTAYAANPGLWEQTFVTAAQEESKRLGRSLNEGERRKVASNLHSYMENVGSIVPAALLAGAGAMGVGGRALQALQGVNAGSEAIQIAQPVFELAASKGGAKGGADPAGALTSLAVMLGLPLAGKAAGALGKARRGIVAAESPRPAPDTPKPFDQAAYTRGLKRMESPLGMEGVTGAIDVSLLPKARSAKPRAVAKAPSVVPEPTAGPTPAPLPAKTNANLDAPKPAPDVELPAAPQRGGAGLPGVLVRTDEALVTSPAKARAEQAKAVAANADAAKPVQAPVEPESNRVYGERRWVSPDVLKVNPDIQYKGGLSDLVNRVTSAFKNVDMYHVGQGGELSVWERLDGSLEIAHGHHRAELAKRAKKFVDNWKGGTDKEVPRELPVRVYKESDGWTLQDIRRNAAIENLRNGNGSALDASMVLRETGVAPEDMSSQYGVSMSAKLSKEVDGLLRLPEDAMRFVRRGEVHESAAAGVGSVAGMDGPAQMAAVKRAGETGQKTYDEGQAFGRVFRDSIVQKPADGDGFGDLFGGEFAPVLDSLTEQVALDKGAKSGIMSSWDDAKSGLKLDLWEGEVIDNVARHAALETYGKRGELAMKIDMVLDKVPEVKDLRRELAEKVKTGNETLAKATRQYTDAVLEWTRKPVKDIIEARDRKGVPGERPQEVPGGQPGKGAHGAAEPAPADVAGPVEAKEPKPYDVPDGWKVTKQEDIPVEKNALIASAPRRYDRGDFDETVRVAGRGVLETGDPRYIIMTQRGYRVMHEPPPKGLLSSYTEVLRRPDGGVTVRSMERDLAKRAGPFYITKKHFVNDVGSDDAVGPERAAMLHRELVETAVEEGRVVTPEVLADYPDIAAKLSPAQKAPGAPPAKTAPAAEPTAPKSKTKVQEWKESNQARLGELEASRKSRIQNAKDKRRGAVDIGPDDFEYVARKALALALEGAEHVEAAVRRLAKEERFTPKETAMSLDMAREIAKKEGVGHVFEEPAHSVGGEGLVSVNSGLTPQSVADALKVNVAPSGALIHGSLRSRLRNAFIENLTDLGKADETAHSLAARLGGAASEAHQLMRSGMYGLRKAAGSSSKVKLLFKTLAESRLRGARQRYLDAGDDAAAKKVGRLMTDDEFDAAVADPGVQRALAFYKEVFEPVFAEAHAINEGVFSDALGPLGTYYPMTALDAEGNPFKRLVGLGRPMRAPSNVRNRMFTGHAPGYDVSATALSDAWSETVRRNVKAALIHRLTETGLVRPVADNAGDTTFRYGGVDYAGRHVLVRPSMTVLGPDNSVAQTKAAYLHMPEWLARELDPVLGNKGDLSPNDLERTMSMLNLIGMAGPLDAVFHSNNVMGVLVANTPYLKGGPLANVPGVKKLNALYQVFKTDPLKDPDAAKDLMRLAKAGALPERTGAVTYSKEYADLTGASLDRLSFGPALYGPRGLDTRARLVMLRTLDKLTPGASDKDVREFVNQMGAYNRALQSTVERNLKRFGVAPFYTAGKTMAMSGARAVTGTTALPNVSPRERFKLIMYQQASGGTLGAVAMWVGLYYGATGKFPWQVPGSRLGMVPLPDDAQDDPLLNKLASGTKGKMEVDVIRLTNPLLARGLRATGAKGAYDALTAGGSPRQAAEAAATGMFNAVLHPHVSGPVTHAAIVGATGREPYMLGLRDMRTGGVAPSFLDTGTGPLNPLAGVVGLNQTAFDAAQSFGALPKSKYREKEEAAGSDDRYQMLFDLTALPRPSRNNAQGRIAATEAIRKAMEQTEKPSKRAKKKRRRR